MENEKEVSEVVELTLEQLELVSGANWIPTFI